LADIFNCEILIPESVESSCWGAALLGFYACDMVTNLSASKNLLKIGQLYTPNLANVKRYAQSYQLFSDLNQQLKPLYLKLAQSRIINTDKEQICQS
jgi:gluconokinase